MVHIVFEKTPKEEVIYGIFISLPEEVVELITNDPEHFRSMPYRMKANPEPFPVG